MLRAHRCCCRVPPVILQLTCCLLQRLAKCVRVFGFFEVDVGFEPNLPLFRKARMADRVRAMPYGLQLAYRGHPKCCTGKDASRHLHRGHTGRGEHRALVGRPHLARRTIARVRAELGPRALHCRDVMLQLALTAKAHEVLNIVPIGGGEARGRNQAPEQNRRVRKTASARLRVIARVARHHQQRVRDVLEPTWHPSPRIALAVRGCDHFLSIFATPKVLVQCVINRNLVCGRHPHKQTRRTSNAPTRDDTN